MSTKLNDYLEPFKNRHICNNKLYNLGELLGIRNYVHIGNLMNSDKLWLSYKYKTIYDDKFINTFTETFEFPFKEYTLNRISKHWKYDVYGNILYKTTMKTAGQLCPWRTNTDIANNNNLTHIQELIGCTLAKNKTCSGFCTFPTNGELTVPSGILWDLTDYIELHNLSPNIYDTWNYLGTLNLKNNINAFIIPSATYDRYIYTASDIEVNDDLEVNFTNNPKTVLDELNASNTLNTLDKSFRSIFQGFGGLQKINSENYKTIPEYLAYSHVEPISGNNGPGYGISGFVLAENTPFNGPHTITEGTLISGWDYEQNKITTILPAGSFAIFRVRNWWSDIIKCTGTLKAVPVVKDNAIEMPLGLSKVLNTTSKFDYVERIYGYFKYQQENLHKSNVYSIKLSNSGLNPEFDEKLRYYEKSELISILETNNYYNQSFKYIEEEDKFYLNSDFNMNSSDITSITFNDMYTISGWGKTISGKTEVYYKLNEEHLVSQKNSVRKNMRTLLETAIRNSVIKYMPIDTTLWKIIYTGK